MNDLLLIVSLAGRRVAFPAGDVEAVVELEGVERVPCVSEHVAGLAALRSRVLTVIDAAVSLGFSGPQSAARLEAVVVPSGGHTYAILVDAVEDVVDAAAPPQPLQAPLGAGWDSFAKGLVEANGDLVLLIDPHGLITGPAALAA